MKKIDSIKHSGWKVSTDVQENSCYTIPGQLAIDCTVITQTIISPNQDKIQIKTTVEHSGEKYFNTEVIKQ